jgi:NSS family neurotransmitter:Na+ symporter
VAADAREQWGSRTGFILAAVGSAVGLGNIWRFPYVAYENGGGAFVVPYLVALLTAGIPVLVLEYTIGHRAHGSAPLSYRRLSRRGEWIGWWQTAVAFVISTYYAVVIAWAAAYTWFAVSQRWGDDPDAFFFETYLGATDAGTLGSFRPLVLVPLLLVWLVTIAVGLRGVQKGIERANRIFIPLLVGMFLLLVVRSVTLPGATTGLETLFTPDWSRIADGDVWVAAYGQIFFSLSIAFAIMIT